MMSNYDLSKTLFVSDLDATLLNSDGTLSDYTANAVNTLVKKGVKLSIATARSYHTAMKVAGKLKVHLPMILHNGVFIRDTLSGQYLHKCLVPDVDFVRKVLGEYGISPMVYSLGTDSEQYSFVRELLSPEQAAFQATREDDPRSNPVTCPDKMWGGDVFYVLCIGSPDILDGAYARLSGKYSCIYGDDYYSGDRWLEIFSPDAGKASAVSRLRDILGCERVVVFGDGANDISMFEIANEAYAVSNAVDALKSRATGIIGSCDEGGVVKWLIEHTGIHI